MSSAIILDTETTGTDAPDPVQLAHSRPLEHPLCDIGGTMCLYFKPRKPISIGAMATHHIIDADVENAPPWTGQWLPPSPFDYLVGHNIDFDWKVIGSPDVKRICTLALARHVWPSIDSHTLSACIYNIYPHSMARDYLARAHDAAADVLNTWRVLVSICSALNLQDWESVYERSELARIPIRFSFGKYKGQNGKQDALISDVAISDPGYIDWCLSGKCDLVNADPYWQAALKKAIGRR
jgi:exodeoxyribonuclease X